jgi:excisionase family DNA binding protein
MTAYRVTDLAARWQCSPNTVRAMIRRGELKPLPFCGKLLRISQQEVEQWEAGEGSGSADTEDDTPSSGTMGASDDAARSARMIAQAPRPDCSNGNVSILSHRREGR